MRAGVRELLQHQLEEEAGCRGADAVVRSAAEAEVRVGGTPRVELVRRGEDSGGGVERDPGGGAHGLLER
ncbi:hypothetical protein, partial [Streptomyces decoyicus]|uniref:hypothetical protein n=1 Tax=Streptomyces decoyicus TaxID=249567 RepID=UPI0033A916B1